MNIEKVRLRNLSKIPGQEYYICPLSDPAGRAIAKTDSLDAAIELAQGDLFAVEVRIRMDGTRNLFDCVWNG